LTETANKLLVVDDDSANRSLLTRGLIRCGYSVEVAATGGEALGKIKQSHYDLVLLDQKMPATSGLDLLALLRATYSQDELPVILVTGVDRKETIIEALRMGANDYVMKPLDLPAITSQIEVHLIRSEAWRRARYTDPLTGLGNRALLVRNLQEAVARQTGSETQQGSPGYLAVLLVDLNDFKVVNDRFGEPSGDSILLEVTSRIRDVFANLSEPLNVTLFRTRGDEFGVLVEATENARRVEAIAAAILHAVSRPLEFEGLGYSLSSRVGFAQYADGQPGAAELLRRAESALRCAKAGGKNCQVRFDPSAPETIGKKHGMALDLAHAVERGELEVFYQPIVNLKVRSISGFEALIRWRHPRHGILSPVEFIPIAEDTGLIIPIGAWILEQACRQLQVWQNKFPQSPPLAMNVNLSVKQLQDEQLLSRVKKLLAETGVPAETLKLELTESALATELEAAKQTLDTLRSLGIGFKLDDFGTGYSSLSYLRTLPFEALKIDQSFVNRVDSDRESRAIVETILGLADSLNMGVVAEGIETENQRTELMDLGCDSGQGFLFSKPLPADAAEQMLQAVAQPA